jgi:hypothetical protein
MLKKNRTRKIIDIDIMIENIKDIFQYNNSLNKEFEEYIFNSIKNYDLDKNIRLKIHVYKKEDSYDNLKLAIQNHFQFRTKQISLQLKQQFKQWIINMIIGILFLVLCLILVEILDMFSYINIIKILKESLLIIGWVALWEPVTFILFGWRIIKRDELLYKKLSNITINIVGYQPEKINMI